MRTRVRVQEIIAIDLGLRTLIVAAMLLMLWAVFASPASAQTGGAPPARDYVSCGHFESQEDAQQVLDSGTLDENGIASLDPDGNGVACEDAFATGGADETMDTAPASVVSLPNTGSGAIATGDSELAILAGFALASLSAALVVRQGSRR